MTEELKNYIDRHQSLFWYTPKEKLHNISQAFLVETILNYGTLDEVKELFALMGTQNVAQVFRAAHGRMIGNYFPEIYNFFTLFFNRYAPRNS